jgi:DNA-binding transcriptional LysR family regulator
MDLRQLRYFQAVAECGHMTRAAAQLGIQQPPLSQQIKALEQQLGMTLFRRHPKGVALTDGGRLFLAETRRILQDMAAMEERMKRVAEGRQGTLSVGFTSSVAAHAFTPQAFRDCRSRYPEIELLVSENNAAEITEALAASRLHCGLLRVPVARPQGLVFETLLREPVLVALPLDHPLLAKGVAAKPRTIAITELRDEKLILVRRPGAPGLYANLLALCERHGFRANVVAEVDRMMTNLNLVAAGVGVSVVPASMQGAHAHAIVYCPLREASALDAPLTLAYREEDCVGATATFVELLRKTAAAWQPKRAARKRA